MSVRFRFIDPAGMSEPLGPYSHGVEVPAGASWLHLAGQVAVDERGQIVGRGDLLAQLDQVFSNLDRLLSEAGYGWRNVVSTTTYLTRAADVDRFRRERMSVYERYFSSSHYPTSTLLVVERLAHESFLLEIAAIAAK